jgi:hypothetical protein
MPSPKLPRHDALTMRQTPYPAFTAGDHAGTSTTTSLKKAPAARAACRGPRPSLLFFHFFRLLPVRRRSAGRGDLILRRMHHCGLCPQNTCLAFGCGATLNAWRLWLSWWVARGRDVVGGTSKAVCVDKKFLDGWRRVPVGRWSGASVEAFFSGIRRRRSSAACRKSSLAETDPHIRWSVMGWY